ncbi:hypothetical protein Y032_0015g2760 [Ancylostoma ceylanicum]|uniref:F-box domain-containing protein n=1 Tax=Ancylostoma ceylanicum TaxID=53326 RepID=A0A016V895_9BILA|nr:hypothetical protein Y032_0015g2760 [Ancylostoma ceylanicum]
MLPDLSWDNIPYELLLNVYRELSYRDLVSCGAVSVHWRHVMRDKILWKRHLKGVYAWWNWEPLVTTSYYDEFMFFKRNIPKFLKEVVNDYDYDLRHCIFSPFGAFFLVCGKGAHFCVYRSDPLEFLHERCLKDSLSWQEITTAQFSPDDSKVMLTGVRQDGSGELAVFSIDPTGEVHFICRSPCSPPGVACWFDNDYLICGEIYQFRFRQVSFLNRLMNLLAEATTSLL